MRLFWQKNKTEQLFETIKKQFAVGGTFQFNYRASDVQRNRAVEYSGSGQVSLETGVSKVDVNAKLLLEKVSFTTWWQRESVWQWSSKTRKWISLPDADQRINPANVLGLILRCSQVYEEDGLLLAQPEDHLDDYYQFPLKITIDEQQKLQSLYIDTKTEWNGKLFDTFIEITLDQHQESILHLPEFLLDLESAEQREQRNLLSKLPVNSLNRMHNKKKKRRK